MTPAAGYTLRTTRRRSTSGSRSSRTTRIRTPRPSWTATRARCTRTPSISRAPTSMSRGVRHWFSFRITEDMQAAETGTGSTLAGHRTYSGIKYGLRPGRLRRLRYEGLVVAVRLQQTPYIDFVEGPYRYRFQARPSRTPRACLSRRTSARAPATFSPMNYGDVHVGAYHGDGLPSQNDQTGVNNEKSFQIRACVAARARWCRPQGTAASPACTTATTTSRTPNASDSRRHDLRAPVRQRRLRVRRREGPDELHEDGAATQRTGYSAWVTPRTRSASRDSSATTS